MRINYISHLTNWFKILGKTALEYGHHQGLFYLSTIGCWQNKYLVNIGMEIIQVTEAYWKSLLWIITGRIYQAESTSQVLGVNLIDYIWPCAKHLKQSLSLGKN